MSDSLSIQKLISHLAPDEIYNLGAMSHVKVSFDIPEYVGDVDGLGTLRLLEAIRILKLENKNHGSYQFETSDNNGNVIFALCNSDSNYIDHESPFIGKSIHIDKNIAVIVILKKGLKLFINLTKGTLDDPKMLMRDVSNTGHWGNGDYELVIKNTDDLEYLMSLIKQAI